MILDKTPEMILETTGEGCAGSRADTRAWSLVCMTAMPEKGCCAGEK